MSRGIALPEVATPTAPPAGYVRLFVDIADGFWKTQDSAGVVTAIGSVGPTGNGVLNGVVAPTTEGTDGDFYIDTVTNTFYGPKASGTWPAGFSLVGPTGATGDQGLEGPAGADGDDGSTILNGTVDPTTEGVDGDFYIRTDTNVFFGPKAAGTWPAGVSLIGPADPITINAQTGTSYTLVLADAGKLVTLSNADPITLTVPLNSSVAFPVGTVIALQQLGAGVISVEGPSGVTINGTDPGDEALTDGQYTTTAALTQHATNVWSLTGAVV